MSTCNLPKGDDRISRARVLIVESLAPDNLLAGVREANATRDVLCILGMSSVFHPVRGLADLDVAAGIFRNGHFDVLHLSCHGSPSGIVLTDGTEVSWRNLADKLGAGMNGKHLVLSACDGGCSQVLKELSTTLAKPSVIIGPATPALWPSLVVAWQVYYRAVFPVFGMADDPCLAVSRVKLATAVELHCHQLVAGKYETFKPTYMCASAVMDEAFGDEVEDLDSVAFGNKE